MCCWLTARVGETAFAADESSQIFRTDDAGRSWQFVDSASGQQILDLALNPAGPSQLVSASNDGIWGQSVPLLGANADVDDHPHANANAYGDTDDHANSYPDRHANRNPDFHSDAYAHTDADRHGHKSADAPRHGNSPVGADRIGRQRHPHPCHTRNN